MFFFKFLLVFTSVKTGRYPNRTVKISPETSWQANSGVILHVPSDISRE